MLENEQILSVIIAESDASRIVLDPEPFEWVQSLAQTQAVFDWVIEENQIPN